MGTTLFAILAIIGGAVVLAKAADTLIDAGKAIGVATGLSPMVIGVVLVGFGTSLPEVLVSVSAVVQGSADIAIANAYGSNITNFGLIMGVSWLLNRRRLLGLSPTNLRQDLLLMLVLLLLAVVPLLDSILHPSESLFLLLLLLGYLGLNLLTSDTVVVETFEKRTRLKIKDVWLALASLGFLIVGARIFTWGAIVIADVFGISEAIIGLTIVALSTSLPELAAAIVGVRKGEMAMIIGNVVGSCIFNSLCVVGIAGIFAVLEFSPDLVARDMPLSLVFAFGSSGLILLSLKKPSRWLGYLLLASYGIYMGWLVAQALI